MLKLLSNIYLAPYMLRILPKGLNTECLRYHKYETNSDVKKATENLNYLNDQITVSYFKQAVDKFKLLDKLTPVYSLSSSLNPTHYYNVNDFVDLLRKYDNHEFNLFLQMLKVIEDTNVKFDDFSHCKDIFSQGLVLGKNISPEANLFQKTYNSFDFLNRQTVITNIQTTDNPQYTMQDLSDRYRIPANIIIDFCKYLKLTIKDIQIYNDQLAFTQSFVDQLDDYLHAK